LAETEAVPDVHPQVEPTPLGRGLFARDPR
jgi:hypothetical protein